MITLIQVINVSHAKKHQLQLEIYRNLLFKSHIFQICIFDATPLIKRTKQREDKYYELHPKTKFASQISVSSEYFLCNPGVTTHALIKSNLIYCISLEGDKATARFFTFRFQMSGEIWTFDLTLSPNLKGKFCKILSISFDVLKHPIIYRSNLRTNDSWKPEFSNLSWCQFITLLVTLNFSAWLCRGYLKLPLIRRMKFKLTKTFKFVGTDFTFSAIQIGCLI